MKKLKVDSCSNKENETKIHLRSCKCYHCKNKKFVALNVESGLRKNPVLYYDDVKHYRNKPKKFVRKSTPNIKFKQCEAKSNVVGCLRKGKQTDCHKASSSKVVTFADDTLNLVEHKYKPPEITIIDGYELSAYCTYEDYCYFESRKSIQ